MTSQADMTPKDRQRAVEAKWDETNRQAQVDRDRAKGLQGSDRDAPDYSVALGKEQQALADSAMTHAADVTKKSDDAQVAKSQRDAADTVSASQADSGPTWTDAAEAAAEKYILYALADGGPTQAGHPYLVGERGPELVVPREHNRVDAFLEGIHPLSYHYKNAESEPRSVPTGGRYLGISAQDLEAVPEVGQQMVSDGPHGKRIESGPTLSAALAGLARLHERVRELESEKHVTSDIYAKTDVTSEGQLTPAPNPWGTPAPASPPVAQGQFAYNSAPTSGSGQLNVSNGAAPQPIASPMSWNSPPQSQGTVAMSPAQPQPQPTQPNNAPAAPQLTPPLQPSRQAANQQPTSIASFQQDQAPLDFSPKGTPGLQSASSNFITSDTDRKKNIVAESTLAAKREAFQEGLDHGVNDTGVPSYMWEQSRGAPAGGRTAGGDYARKDAASQLAELHRREAALSAARENIRDGLTAAATLPGVGVPIGVGMTGEGSREAYRADAAARAPMPVPPARREMTFTREHPDQPSLASLYQQNGGR